MGPRITFKRELLPSPRLCLFRVTAPEVAGQHRPGQFVVLMVHERGERIPLTIVDADAGTGEITLIVQAIGKTTGLLADREVGDPLYSLVGPLGMPTELGAFGHVVSVGGGYGTAAVLPIVRGLVAAGSRVTCVTGARSRDLLIMTGELGAAAHRLVVTTDDGSAGRKGLVTDALADLMAEGPIARVIAVGPVPMMEAVSNLTRDTGIPTIVSLNPIMVDGTGMCGGCRVTVGGETVFACVKGPEFDGHQVDWQELKLRLATYRDHELQALMVGSGDPR